MSPALAQSCSTTLAHVGANKLYVYGAGTRVHYYYEDATKGWDQARAACKTRAGWTLANWESAIEFNAIIDYANGELDGKCVVLTREGGLGQGLRFAYYGASSNRHRNYP